MEMEFSSDKYNSSSVGIFCKNWFKNNIIAILVYI